MLFRRITFDCRELWCSTRQTVCLCCWARNNKAVRVSQDRTWQPGAGQLRRTGTVPIPALGISHLPGMWTSWGPGWDVGLWIGVRIRPGAGTHGPCTQDGLAGPWKWGQGQANSTPGDGKYVSPYFPGVGGWRWSFRSILAVTQRSKGRDDVSSKRRELLEILFPYLYGKTFMPLSDQMVVHFYPNPKVWALMQILLLATFTQQHYLAKRCSCFSSGMSIIETEFLRGREVEGMRLCEWMAASTGNQFY